MRIIILNDGETWTTAEGCVMVDVPDELGNLHDWEIKDLHRKSSLDRKIGLWSDQDKLIEAEVIARF